MVVVDERRDRPAGVGVTQLARSNSRSSSARGVDCEDDEEGAKAAATPTSVLVVEVVATELPLINQGNGLGLRLLASSTKCETELLNALFRDPNVHAAVFPLLTALALVLGMTLGTVVELLLLALIAELLLVLAMVLVVELLLALAVVEAGKAPARILGLSIPNMLSKALLALCGLGAASTVSSSDRRLAPVVVPVVPGVPIAGAIRSKDLLDSTFSNDCLDTPVPVPTPIRSYDFLSDTNRSSISIGRSGTK
jgi:hypothetical protein